MVLTILGSQVGLVFLWCPYGDIRDSTLVGALELNESSQFFRLGHLVLKNNTTGKDIPTFSRVCMLTHKFGYIHTH